MALGTAAQGQILVDSQGRTLYMFAADTTPTASQCNGACAAAWPPATVTGTPTAGSGLTASLLTTLTRTDGTTQLVYNGHPLYTFTGDSAAGQTNGEGINAFGAVWNVVNAAGNKV